MCHIHAVSSMKVGPKVSPSKYKTFNFQSVIKLCVWLLQKTFLTVIKIENTMSVGFNIRAAHQGA